MELVRQPNSARPAGEDEVILPKHEDKAFTDHAAVVLAEDSMLRLSRLEVGPPVGRDEFEEGLGLWAFDAGFQQRRPISDVAVRFPGDALVDPA